jgi:salicylate hydroxylase
MQRLRAYTQAHLPIHIAIVGGGLAGLTTALALTRVGHRVTVFEQHSEDAPLPSGGVRIPPNQSKVLTRWGLKEDLAKITVVSKALRFYTCMLHGSLI